MKVTVQLLLISIASLAGCTHAQREAVNTVGIAAVDTAEILDPPAAPILTASAKLGCLVQGIANDVQPPTHASAAISVAAGMACTW